MSTWKTKLPANKVIKFEVVGKEARWQQFSRIKARDSSELSLSDKVGDSVTVASKPMERWVYFTPYHNTGSNVDEDKIRVKDTGIDAWLLEMEDAGDGDYNDYIVRASISDEKRV